MQASRRGTRHVLRALSGLVLAGVLGACAHAPGAGAAASAAVAPARSPAGKWVGVVNIPSMDAIPVTVTLDSAAGRWSGAVTAEPLGASPVAFESVRRAADSLEVHLPEAGQYAVLRGRLSPDGRSLEGVVDVHDTQGTFRLARSGTPEAAALTRAP